MAGTPWRRRRTTNRTNSAPAEEDSFVSAAERTHGFTRTGSLSAGTGTPADTDTIIDITDGAAQREAAEQYSAWAERLRQRTVRDQDDFRGEPATVSAGANATWSSQSLFAESQRIADSATISRYDRTGLSGAYAVLELRPGATLEQVDAQYRLLAKQHHPDRFAGDDPDVQLDHATTFRSVNNARDILRQHLGAP